MYVNIYSDFLSFNSVYIEMINVECNSDRIVYD